MSIPDALALGYTVPAVCKHGVDTATECVECENEIDRLQAEGLL